MSCDKLVFDLSQEVEGSPSVFVKKDWVNILDNQNGQYSANQSVVDTSQLSNSNKYMSYREGYLAVPLMLSLMSDKTAGALMAAAGVAAASPVAPAVYNIEGGSSADMAIGLKNWFGQIVHSITLDYNGTTIVQQTQYINMWNSFKLLTTLSWGDVATSGATMGFYPDDPLAWTFNTIASPDGIGVCNNVNAPISALPASGVAGQFADYASGNGNIGFLKRQQYIAYDPDGVVGLQTAAYALTNRFSTLLTATSASALWKSYVITKTSSTASVNGLLQIAVMATIHLKHLHSFFQQTPLLKGVFMKMTLALNNTSCVVTRASGVSGTMTLVSTSNSVGGVNPLMLASSRASGGVESSSGVITATAATAPAVALTLTLNAIDYRITAGMIVVGAGVLGGTTILSVSHSATATTITTAGISNLATNPITWTATAYTFLSPNSAPVQSLLASGGFGIGTIGATLTADISVGSKALSSAVSAASTASTAGYQNVILYVPAYTFNPTFESAYLSSPIKKIKYTDVYQYQVQSVGAGGTFNNLLTNGIANIKSVLIIPFYAQETGSSVIGSLLSVPVWQSPFDPAGTGPTSPLCALTNFNVVISGQNAIYNTQKYGFEEFIHQLQGVNSVNGNMTDGLTSSLINFTGFEMEYCYYYVDVSRMLPVEESVPKSVQIIGTSLSARVITLMCFIEYGCEVDIDILTGARV